MVSQKKKFETVYSWLVEAAMQDGKITPEEKAILDEISHSFEIWENAVEEAKKDGHVDEAEVKELRGIIGEIYKGAVDVAMKDGFSQDEQNLLAYVLLGLKSLALK